jgi:hypothetical protein
MKGSRRNLRLQRPRRRMDVTRMGFSTLVDAPQASVSCSLAWLAVQMRRARRRTRRTTPLGRLDVRILDPLRKRG